MFLRKFFSQDLYCLNVPHCYLYFYYIVGVARPPPPGTLPPGTLIRGAPPRGPPPPGTMPPSMEQGPPPPPGIGQVGRLPQQPPGMAGIPRGPPMGFPPHGAPPGAGPMSGHLPHHGPPAPHVNPAFFSGQVPPTLQAATPAAGQASSSLICKYFRLK